MNILFKNLFFFLIAQGIILPQLVTQNWSTEKNIFGNTSKTHLYSNESNSIGIRTGIGTDIDLGFVYGGGINYLFNIN